MVDRKKMVIWLHTRQFIDFPPTYIKTIALPFHLTSHYRFHEFRFTSPLNHLILYFQGASKIYFLCRMHVADYGTPFVSWSHIYKLYIWEMQFSFSVYFRFQNLKSMLVMDLLHWPVISYRASAIEKLMALRLYV